VASTGYAIGLPGGGASIHVAPETVWGTVPTDGYKRLRITGDTLASSKTRDRPNEIDSSWGVSSSSVTEKLAGGALSFVQSLGNADDLLAAVCCSTWAAGVPAVGQDTLFDGTIFQSFTIEKQVAPALFFRFPGSYPTSFSFAMQRGQFLGGDINVVSKDAVSAVAAADASVTAANTGRVFSTVGGVKSITLGATPLGRIVNMTFTITRQGADRQMTIDSVAASGISPGLIEVRCEGEFYFANLDLYNAYLNDTVEAFSFRIADGADKGYTFTLLEPNVDAPEPPITDKTRPLTARFAFSSNPDASGRHVSVVRNLV
jgi:Phage tail tube protein